MRCVGLDIGGANVKAADNDGLAVTKPFAIWKEPDQLTTVLRDLLCHFPGADAIAVTMTAELADCFESKSQGVDEILKAVEMASAGKPVFVWQTGSEFVSVEVAREFPLLVAAANWHALASWAGRMTPQGLSILIDIGTTTTDIIPMENGHSMTEGLTDIERLLSGELIYTGSSRTPVCAVTPTVTFRGQDCPLAAELFATTQDVYLLLGEFAENPDDHDTANGRPATIDAACDRLARMLCCDSSEISKSELTEIASQIASSQRQAIGEAMRLVLGRYSTECEKIIISGSGEFLAEAVIRETVETSSVEVTRLSTVLSSDVAQAACAFAVARLAHERLGEIFLL